MIRHQGEAAQLREVAILDRHAVAAEDPHGVHIPLHWPEFEAADSDVAGPDFEDIRGVAGVHVARLAHGSGGTDHQRGPRFPAAANGARSLIPPP